MQSHHILPLFLLTALGCAADVPNSTPQTNLIADVRGRITRMSDCLRVAQQGARTAHPADVEQFQLVDRNGSSSTCTLMNPTVPLERPDQGETQFGESNPRGKITRLERMGVNRAPGPPASRQQLCFDQTNGQRAPQLNPPWEGPALDCDDAQKTCHGTANGQGQCPSATPSIASWTLLEYPEARPLIDEALGTIGEIRKAMEGR